MLAQVYGTPNLPRTTLFRIRFSVGLNPLPLDGKPYTMRSISGSRSVSPGLNLGVAYTNSKQIDNCCDAQMGAFVIDPCTAQRDRRGNVEPWATSEANIPKPRQPQAIVPSTSTTFPKSLAFMGLRIAFRGGEAS